MEHLEQSRRQFVASLFVAFDHYRQSQKNPVLLDWNEQPFRYSYWKNSELQSSEEPVVVLRARVDSDRWFSMHSIRFGFDRARASQLIELLESDWRISLRIDGNWYMDSTFRDIPLSSGLWRTSREPDLPVDPAIVIPPRTLVEMIATGSKLSAAIPFHVLIDGFVRFTSPKLPRTTAPIVALRDQSGSEV